MYKLDKEEIAFHQQALAEQHQTPIASLDKYADLTRYLKALPFEDIDEQGDPFNAKERWMKFFDSSNNRAKISVERALKNEMDVFLHYFISDKKTQMNDQ